MYRSLAVPNDRPTCTQLFRPTRYDAVNVSPLTCCGASPAGNSRVPSHTVTRTWPVVGAACPTAYVATVFWPGAGAWPVAKRISPEAVLIRIIFAGGGVVSALYTMEVSLYPRTIVSSAA